VSINQVVSGVGKDSKRTDRNISERVAKVQREAKIQNATGGTYSQATQLQNIASGASTEVPSAVVTPARVNTVATNVDTSFLDTVNPNPVIMTDGAPGNTAGRQPEELPAPVDAPDNNALIARAMFMMDPTPQNRRLLESFQQEGR
jgi:hypothetical protein